MSVIALRYAVLRFVESGEESYGCVAHCTIDELSPIFFAGEKIESYKPREVLGSCPVFRELRGLRL